MGRLLEDLLRFDEAVQRPREAAEREPSVEGEGSSADTPHLCLPSILCVYQL